MKRYPFLSIRRDGVTSPTHQQFSICSIFVLPLREREAETWLPYSFGEASAKSLLRCVSVPAVSVKNLRAVD